MLKNLKEWFSNYVAKFYRLLGERHYNIRLKEQHTYKVCQEAIELGKTLKLTNQELYLAEISALFHDVGRFMQWYKYKTFQDSKSENHALLGLKELEKHQVLFSLSQKEQRLICTAIQYHNVFKIPEMEDPQAKLLTQILRDADKLDILRVFMDYNKIKQEPSLEWDLPQTPGYSKEIISDLYQKRISSHENLKNGNDFKLMLLCWVFDINFAYTREQILKRGFIQKICKSLPQCKEIQEIEEYLLQYLRVPV